MLEIWFGKLPKCEYFFYLQKIFFQPLYLYDTAIDRLVLEKIFSSINSLLWHSFSIFCTVQKCYNLHSVFLFFVLHFVLVWGKSNGGGGGSAQCVFKSLEIQISQVLGGEEKGLILKVAQFDQLLICWINSNTDARCCYTAHADIKLGFWCLSIERASNTGNDSFAWWHSYSTFINTQRNLW